jgi:phosphocarrier protein NPr
MLESHQGETVRLVSEGKDAVAALAAVERLIVDKFNEEE